MSSDLFFFLLVISFSLINAIEFQKINIISLKQNKTLEYQDVKIKKNSLFSQICNKVLDSYDFIGKDGMNLYEGCDGKYDLLAKNNSKIQTDNPMCFNNLDAFFCKIHVKENPKLNINNTINAETLQVILSTLQGCLNQNLTLNKAYHCPSLNNASYKVENSTLFCKDGMKPERFPERNNTTTYDYAIIPIEMRESCEKIVEVYNACIDSDNLLFPKSNYMRCFNPKHALYINSEIEFLNETEKDLCSNFILPSIAWKNIRDSQFNKVARFHCESFEYKTFKNYELFTEEALRKEQSYLDIVKLQKKRLEKSTIIRTKTRKLSFNLKTLSEFWANFYPKFTSMYFKKDSIPSRNFLLYENIKKNMDALYEHSEKILKLTRSGKYALAEFKDYFIWLLKLHETTENLMKNIMENMKKLYDIINPDPKKLALQIIPSDKDVLKFSLTHKRIASDQNEFINMNINLNTFFDFTLKRSENNKKRFTDIENKYFKKSQDIKYIRKSLVQQKKQLKKLIIEDFKHN